MKVAGVWTLTPGIAISRSTYGQASACGDLAIDRRDLAVEEVDPAQAPVEDQPLVDRGTSQGRPRTTSSSQLISHDGLPDRVSQQRPLFPEPEGSRRRRTAVSSPDNGSAFTARAFKLVLSGRGVAHRRGGYRDPAAG